MTRRNHNLFLTSLPVLGSPSFVTLPQNLVLNPGSLFESFESAAAWTPTSSPSGGTLANDAVNYKVGAQSIKMTTPTSSGYIRMDKTINSVLTGNVRFWVYCYDSTPSNSCVIRFSNDAPLANTFELQFATQLRNAPGWNLIQGRQSQWTVLGGSPSWSSPMVNIQVRFYTNTTAHAYSIDGLYDGTEQKPAFAITFDDGSIYQYTEGLAYMQPRNVRGSLMVVSDWVGTGGYVSWAQVLEFYAAGWSICNHTKDHTNLTTLSEAEQETEISNCDAALAANGVADRRSYVAYPQGGYNADTFTAMAAQSMSIGRTIIAAYEHLPLGAPYLLPGRACEGQTLATVTGWIDTIIAQQKVGICYIHGLQSAPGAGNWYIDRFQGLVDYCISHHVPLVTLDDLYQLQTGPVIIPRAG